MTNPLNPSIPAAAHNPSADQGPMQTNFQSIYNWSAVDHVQYGNTGSGFHIKSTYVDQEADPGSAASQVVQYGKSSSGSSELFIQRDGVVAPVQLTAGVPIVAGNGSTFLAGGLILKYFTIMVNPTANPIFSVIGVGAFPNNAFLAVFGNSTSGGNFFYSALTATGMTITTSGTNPAVAAVIVIGN